MIHSVLIVNAIKQRIRSLQDMGCKTARHLPDSELRKDINAECKQLMALRNELLHADLPIERLFSEHTELVIKSIKFAIFENDESIKALRKHRAAEWIIIGLQEDQTDLKCLLTHLTTYK